MPGIDFRICAGRYNPLVANAPRFSANRTSAYIIHKFKIPSGERTQASLGKPAFTVLHLLRADFSANQEKTRRLSRNYRDGAAPIGHRLVMVTSDRIGYVTARLEPSDGFEPPTRALQVRRSASELTRLNFFCPPDHSLYLNF